MSRPAEAVTPRQEVQPARLPRRRHRQRLTAACASKPTASGAAGMTGRNQTRPGGGPAAQWRTVTATLTPAGEDRPRPIIAR